MASIEFHLFWSLIMTIDIFGYLGAVAIGLVLGLIGGGGSILTVPIFVYVFGIDPILSTAYSLFVVGFTALVGTIRNIQKDIIDYKTGFIFAIPAFISVFLTRMYFIPLLPDIIYQSGNFIISKELAIMIFFSGIMILSAIFMIKNRHKSKSEPKKVVYNFPMIALEGIVVGFLTGIVGAGGGFLIIPALVLFAKLPMKKAVATSLMIIAFKSLIGFIGDVQNFEIDWTFLITFTSISIVGIFVGIYLNNFIDGKKLKKGFGWFILFMGMYILIKEIFE